MAWGNTNVYKLAMGKKYILSLLLFVFNWSIVVYTAVSVSAVHKVNQPYIYIFPLFGGSSFHLGYHRVLNKSSLCYRAGSHYLPTLYIRVCVCVCVCVYTCQSPNSSHPLLPPWYPYICSPHLCLCFCFANKIIYKATFQDKQVSP